MYTVYHYPLCPFSRQIRVLLKELGIEFNTEKEEYWRRTQRLISMNPAGELPVVVDENGKIYSQIHALIEYFREINEASYLFPESVEARYLMRNLIFWYNNKFYREVTKYIIDEKLIKLLTRVGSPDSEIIRVAKTNLAAHLKYMESYISKNYSDYLASENFTVADIAASCQLSVLDFFDEIFWDSYPNLKHWYCLIKSRPSFTGLLNDFVPGFNPPSHYYELDF